MKSTLKIGLASRAALALLATVTVTYGQLPVSRTVANSPVAVAGTSAATALSVPFTQPALFREIVDAVAGQDITGDGGGYPAFAASTHMVLIKTGAGYGVGLPIVSNTASTLTVSGTVPALTVGSDEFEIVPLPTLNSVFGGVATAGPTDLTGSPSAGAADIVIINALRYFYKTTGAGAPGWKLDTAPNSAPDLGTTAIPNLRGVFVIRKGAATTVNVRGVVREGRAAIDIPAGTTLLSWPFPQETTLLDSKLQGSITGGPSAGAADLVIIDGLRYFYKTSGAAAPGWKLDTAPNAALPGANDVALNPGGRAFFVNRKTGATAHLAEESYAD